MLIRPPRPDESPRLLAVAVATGLFDVDEAAALLGSILGDHHAGRLPAWHGVHVCTGADDVVAGWTYSAPAFKADGVWDLWWIGVDPEAHGTGVGGALIAFVEQRAKDAGGRLLVVETSATPPLARARAFYARHGYTRCGAIPDYYADGDDKVIFAKRLSPG